MCIIDSAYENSEETMKAGLKLGSKKWKEGCSWSSYGTSLSSHCRNKSHCKDFKSSNILLDSVCNSSFTLKIQLSHLRVVASQLFGVKMGLAPFCDIGKRVEDLLTKIYNVDRKLTPTMLSNSGILSAAFPHFRKWWEAAQITNVEVAKIDRISLGTNSIYA
ncbi:hypothetical protein C5167_012566 [Papaver somniferum]|uniref:Uncharacterized protein n=1 Tax=Papaver somniferum TaxID=3469 RepID=A0A4Y7J0Z6_PAPSO|nr:hypothetical protein C5167_012566 [Papaver somniferum]